MKTMHFCLSVRGALRSKDRQLKVMFKDKETGRYVSAGKARDILMDHLAAGREVLPLGKCEGFDFKEGCPGHEQPEAANG